MTHYHFSLTVARALLMWLGFACAIGCSTPSRDLDLVGGAVTEAPAEQADGRYRVGVTASGTEERQAAYEAYVAAARAAVGDAVEDARFRRAMTHHDWPHVLDTACRWIDIPSRQWHAQNTRITLDGRVLVDADAIIAWIETLTTE